MQFDSLKHKKKTKTLNWKDQKKKEAPSIDFWNDVFLFTDKYSSKSYAILLVNINLFQNNWGTSGADVFLQIGSLITSTYVINLPGKLSEDNLEYLSFLNRMSSNSSGSKRPFKDIMFLIRDWVNLKTFKLWKNFIKLILIIFLRTTQVLNMEPLEGNNI